MELLKRFENGKTLKPLDPIEDMEIDYDPDTDELDIKELVSAQEKVSDELHKPNYKSISKA